MLHVLEKIWIVPWSVAVMFALRWHHVLRAGSQSDNGEPSKAAPSFVSLSGSSAKH
jgi:hypothetical protein